MKLFDFKFIKLTVYVIKIKCKKPMKYKMLTVLAIAGVTLASCGSNKQNNENSDTSMTEESTLDTAGGSPTMTDSISTDNSGVSSGGGSATGTGTDTSSTGSGSGSAPTPTP